MSETLKRHIISGVVTFIATFLTTLSAILLQIPIENWTTAGKSALIAGAVVTAVRAGIKTVTEKFIISR